MKARKVLFIGVAFLLAFILWTVMIVSVDIQPVGQQGTAVGFAAFNTWFYHLTGVHMRLYDITDWLGLVPIAVCIGFGVIGLVQLIRRRSLFKVDPDIILLGVYYILVIAAYIIFEMIPINYRPIPIDGCMEASYPSSTTLLVLSVMPTLIFQIKRRCNNKTVRYIVCAFAVSFSAFMVVGRLIAGVHWATDIIGSILLSFGLFAMYHAAVRFSDMRKEHGIQ
ncbi:phosphatase PAP2 family protein [Ruminococcus sp.]|uniref:phosphatase PAP2 family protein n=1 Tax=Ruminococcus sp. TaxID=41978 RepID=UPI002872B017|nr:phosphatase PAP2 family protein [Ruminococcus sp.]